MRSSGSGKKQNFFWRHFNGIAMAAIVLIPTIYTTLFLGSMWDPYGNVDQLPVAVVNNDKSVDYEGKELAVGDELVDKLRENDQLDFHFVSADKAEKGIEDGTYYMVITIPENFSENASTLMDDEPQKMELQYVTNPGTNYIASKMSETALAKIQKEVSESVTKEYTETIFDQLGTIGSGMSDAADGALQIQDGVSDLKDGNTKITDNLKLLSDSSLTFVDGAKTLESGLKTYTDGVATVNSGAQTLSDGMDQLASGAGTLADGAVALSDGSGTLSNGVSSYTDGVSAAYSGAQTLDGSSSQLENGAASLTSGAAQLQRLVEQGDLEAGNLRACDGMALVILAGFVAEGRTVQLTVLVHRGVHAAGGYVVHAHTAHAHAHQRPDGFMQVLRRRIGQSHALACVVKTRLASVGVT